jgi:CubicO group peptidase (beta-lactamase class C family)
MAANWVARHGLTSAQYQQAFEDFSKKGFRLTSISGYDSGGARYAALWTKQSGPDWSARHGLNPQQYQAAFDDYAKKGYRLRFVNGYTVANQPYYAGIWDKSAGPASKARHGLSAEQYQAVFDDMLKDGYAISHVSVLSIGGSPRFAAIFEKNGLPTAARHGLTAGEYQNAFEDYAAKGFRLKVASGYKQGASDRYAAIWVKTGGPQWSARHGIPDEFYQHVFDNYTYQSWEPQYIQAFNSASGVRFNGVWENTAFKASDLALIDSQVRAYMKANDVPGISIAISRNEKLVYAAGYGNADVEKGEPVGPSHRFRIASVSKPITRVAVARVVQDTNLDMSSKIFGNNSVLGSQYATPANNPKIVDITVEHLIGHRGGWVNINKDGDKSDPMFAYTGTDHKGLIEWTLKNYPLGFDPGSEESYSNFGYSLLGRVIETKTGKGYEAYVRDTILKPAGANGIVIGGDKEADRKSNEVKYYGGGAYSSVKPKRFDAHGGWIATPSDLLRFLKYESVLGNSYGHYGEMSGTTSVLRRRSDGFSMAAVSNRSNDSTEAMNTMLKEIVEGVSKWPDTDLF